MKFHSVHCILKNCAKRRCKENLKVYNIPPSTIRELKHMNLCTFFGVAVHDSRVLLVSQYVGRGSLYDVLLAKNSCLDEAFLASLLQDLLRVRNRVFLRGQPQKNL